jgi:hypothetical protein
MLNPQVPLNKANARSRASNTMRLARVSPHKQHPALAEPDMGGFHITVAPLSRTTSWLQSN